MPARDEAQPGRHRFALGRWFGATSRAVTLETPGRSCGCSKAAEKGAARDEGAKPAPSKTNSSPGAQDNHGGDTSAAAATAAAAAGTREGHPFDAASLCAKLFFSWMLPFIWLGWRVGLRRAHLPSQPDSDELCSKLGKQLEANWTQEVKACNWRCQPSGLAGGHSSDGWRPNQRRPSLVRVLLRTHWLWILSNSLLALFAEVICKSLLALSVGQLLYHMNARQYCSAPDEMSGQRTAAADDGGGDDGGGGADATTTTTTSTALVQCSTDWLAVWTFALIGASFSWVLSAHFYGFQMMRVGLRLRVGCSHLIYRKSLALGLSSQSSQATLGRMVNLLSNDLDKFNHVCILLPFLWLGPLQTLVSLALLWPQLGASCLGSLLILAALTPLQVHLSRLFGSYRARIAAATDERVQSLNETFGSIRTIKLYGWELPFKRRLFALRDCETRLISRVAILKGLSAALMCVASKMVLFVTILLHCLVFSRPLDAATLFTSMAMLNNVQFTMSQLMPRVVALGAEALVSIRRINDFLLQEEFARSTRLWLVDWTSSAAAPAGAGPAAGERRELKLRHYLPAKPRSAGDISLDQKRLTPLSGALTPASGVAAALADHCSSPFVQCQNVGARWARSAGGAPTLDGLSFRFQAPQLVMVCGPVAGGKSSLLLALLNELPIDEGTAQISGSVSYASQSAWIFNGTLRDNVLFGQQLDERRYRRVLAACQLTGELDDSARLGPDSLSGGQRARVNLARCLYRQCDIYLLDDPLSALDARVARRVFERAICELLADKLVLLATHQVGFVARCHRVLVLDQGRQLANCEPGKLRAMLAAPVGEHFTRKQLDSLAFLRSALVERKWAQEQQQEEEGATVAAGGAAEPKSMDAKDDEEAELDEVLATGGAARNPAVWLRYYGENPRWRLALVLAAFLISQALLSTVDVFLTVWSMSEQNRARLLDINQSNQFWLDSVRRNQAFAGHQLFRNRTEPISNSSALIDYDQLVRQRADLNFAQGPRLSFAGWSAQGDNAPRLDQARNFYPTFVQLATRSQLDRNIIFGPARRATTSGDSSYVPLPPPTSDAPPLDGTDQLQREAAQPQQPDQSGDAILLESREALNVRPVYRPLYLLVGGLDSADLAAIYAALLVALFLASALTNILSLKCCNQSARRLYRRLIDAALHAQLSFYDLNPIGRLLNRATRDFGIIDEAIPYNVNQAYEALLQTLATLALVTAVEPRLAPVSLVVVLAVLAVYSIQIGPTKDLQRLEGVARSPLLSHAASTLAGLQTIRSNQASAARLIDQFAAHQDAHSSVWLLKLGCNRTTAVYLDLFNAFYVSLVTLSAVLSDAGGPSAGLIITSAILLSGLTQHGVMKLTETESLLTSVERVLEYCSLPPEEPVACRDLRRPNSVITDNRTAVWPSEGCLEFKNVDLYYPTAAAAARADAPAGEQSGRKGRLAQPSAATFQWAPGKPVLKNLSFRVEARQKVGIIGRTGAGKSSLISALFRLHHFQGQVLLDGVDTKRLNLIELRASIGIIPQRPDLFAGLSIRQNLDPWGAHDDFAVWSALGKANLRETISQLAGKLDFVVDSRERFSSGQRQLICLARVLLRRAKLVVLDEATASVDPTTDSHIQATIRSELAACTLLIIAHRLETILDCDRVLCLEAGRLVDFDTPQRLAARSGSYLAQMLARSGPQQRRQSPPAQPQQAPLPPDDADEQND